MSFDQLKVLFEESQRKLTRITKEFNWTDRNCYAEWLGSTLNYVENSTRLLALAGGTMPADKTAISNRFISHASEERGHDKLLRNDLIALGFNIESFKPNNEMLFYSRSLYYWVSPVGNPVGLIGWVLSLEGVAASVGPEVYEVTTDAFGKKATSFLKVHAEADPDHLKKALEITKDLDDQDLEAVSEALMMYSNQYQKVLHSIENKIMVGKAA